MQLLVLLCAASALAQRVISIVVNSQEVSCSGGCQAIVDTGTSLVAGPPSGISNIQMVLEARQDSNGEHKVICSSIPATPDLVFVIDVVPAWVYAEQHDQGSCTSGFQTTSGDLWILGKVFLRVYYSVFDRANNRLGLAKAV